MNKNLFISSQVFLYSILIFLFQIISFKIYFINKIFYLECLGLLKNYHNYLVHRDSRSLISHQMLVLE
jgi:hypothetical protein